MSVNTGVWHKCLEGSHLCIAWCEECIDVAILLERVVDVASQLIEVLGEGGELYFHFDDICLFSLGLFFVLACASLFLTLFCLEEQGGVSGASGRWSAGVEETWRWEADALSFWGIFPCANVNFKAKTGKVVGEEVDSYFDVSTGLKEKCTAVYIYNAEEIKECSRKEGDGLVYH